MKKPKFKKDVNDDHIRKVKEGTYLKNMKKKINPDSSPEKNKGEYCFHCGHHSIFDIGTCKKKCVNCGTEGGECDQ